MVENQDGEKIQIAIAFVLNGTSSSSILHPPNNASKFKDEYSKVELID